MILRHEAQRRPPEMQSCMIAATATYAIFERSVFIHSGQSKKKAPRERSFSTVSEENKKTQISSAAYLVSAFASSLFLYMSIPGCVTLVTLLFTSVTM